MLANNQSAYNTKKVVKEYNTMTNLFKGEIPIYNKFKDNKDNGKMLDIGIGTGRTTKYFAPFFNEYHGIDYAEEMVKAAKNKFSLFENAKFYHTDARKMSQFKDNEFDFILFSFNGLDFVSFEDRQKILSEVKRIAKPNAIFSYSTHNIYNIPKLFSFRIPRNPFNLLSEIKRHRKINELNKPIEQLIKNDYVYIKDGSVDFSVEFYYCNIDFELTLLKKLGFKPYEIYSLKNGNQYELNTNWSTINTPWIMINSQINV